MPRYSVEIRLSQGWETMEKGLTSLNEAMWVKSNYEGSGNRARVVSHPDTVNRWQCPVCNSAEVQVSFPTWCIEHSDGTIETREVDAEADILYWFCPACENSGSGEPKGAE